MRTSCSCLEVTMKTIQGKELFSSASRTLFPHDAVGEDRNSPATAPRPLGPSGLRPRRLLSPPPYTEKGAGREVDRRPPVPRQASPPPQLTS